MPDMTHQELNPPYRVLNPTVLKQQLDLNSVEDFSLCLLNVNTTIPFFGLLIYIYIKTDYNSR